MDVAHPMLSLSWDDLLKSDHPLTIHPQMTHETRFFFGGVGGGVGEVPCIRKLDTEFCYIGILYIC